MNVTKRHNWDKKALKELERLRNLGLTMREIANRLGLNYKQVDNAIRRYQVDGLVRKIQMSDMKDAPPVEEMIDYLKLGQELTRRFDPRQKEVNPEYNTDKWVGIPFLGDFHFDHYKTDINSLIDCLDGIGAEEDVFAIINGDVGDNSDIRFPGYHFRGVILPIEMRMEIAFYLINKIRNILALVAGDHDDWLINRSFDMISAIKKKRNEKGLETYYLGYGGFINFKVGKIMYRIAVHHRWGYESSTNDFHTCQKFLREMDATCDVVAIAHRHDKTGIEFTHYQRIPRIFVRSGSVQYLTDYAWKYGFGGAIDKAPMILLNGSEKRMLAFPNYKEGIEELRRLNSE